MAIEAPDHRATRSRLADWLELQCLIRPRGVSMARALRYLTRISESDHTRERDVQTGEDLEQEILEPEAEQWGAELVAEVEARSEVLGVEYPFTVRHNLQHWWLESSPEDENPVTRAGRSCYLFCLLVSAVRDRTIIGSLAEKLKSEIAGCFERLAERTASGILGGEVLSLGWPRQSGSKFRDALEQASGRMGLGTVRSDMPDWSMGQEKDAGVDLIVCRGFRDGQPGKLLILAQVKSGRRWQKESLDSGFRKFHDWFVEDPAKHFVPALVIPFPQHHECFGRPPRDFDTVARAEASRRERDFGLVLDRLRLVEATARAMATEAETGAPALPRCVRRWIEDAIAAAAAR